MCNENKIIRKTLEKILNLFLDLFLLDVKKNSFFKGTKKFFSIQLLFFPKI